MQREHISDQDGVARPFLRNGTPQPVQVRKQPTLDRHLLRRCRCPRGGRLARRGLRLVRVAPTDRLGEAQHDRRVPWAFPHGARDSSHAPRGLLTRAWTAGDDIVFEAGEQRGGIQHRRCRGKEHRRGASHRASTHARPFHKLGSRMQPTQFCSDVAPRLAVLSNTPATDQKRSPETQ